MPIDAAFYRTIEPLFQPGFGTESVGPLLYSLVRMTRPRNVLEVGLGYTSPFIALALKDNLDEFAADRALIAARPAKGGLDDTSPENQRRSILDADFCARDYEPRLHVIDNFSIAGTTAPLVLDALKALELDFAVVPHEGDFRGLSAKLDARSLPFDFVWFDCGGFPEYLDFLAEYWPLINPDHGLLLLHFTYWYLTMERDGREIGKLLSGPIANEIKRQQMAAGFDGRFEALSLVEPHKTSQGSVTMVRKLPPESMTRNSDFREEMFEIFGQAAGSMVKL